MHTCQAFWPTNLYWFAHPPSWAVEEATVTASPTKSLPCPALAHMTVVANDSGHVLWGCCSPHWQATVGITEEEQSFCFFGVCRRDGASS